MDVIVVAACSSLRRHDYGQRVTWIRNENVTAEDISLRLQISKTNLVILSNKT